jgi:hypothetical protein
LDDAAGAASLGIGQIDMAVFPGDVGDPAVGGGAGGRWGSDAPEATDRHQRAGGGEQESDERGGETSGGRRPFLMLLRAGPIFLSVPLGRVSLGRRR